MEGQDNPVWKLEPTRKFTVKSAWNYIRQGGKEFDLKKYWLKGLPFKIAFLIWRMCKEKVFVDIILRR